MSMPSPYRPCACSISKPSLANPAVIAIGLASLSNLAFKSGLVIAIGGKPLARRVLPGLAAIGVGFVLGIFLLA